MASSPYAASPCATGSPLLTTPALSSLRFDAGAYQATLAQSVGPGNYVLEALKPHCGACLQGDPRVAVGTSGASICGGQLVDVESELHNVGRRATLAPGGQYRGNGGPPTVCPGPANGRLQPFAACDGLATVDTRLANPPCTLRGTGWNRWEWLCQNPQDRVLMPFDAMVDTSLVVKDNHRPHLARPLDPTLALPPGGRVADASVGAPEWIPAAACSGAVGPTNEPPNMLWRSCGEVNRLSGHP
jgi:hypothetical protein